MFKFLRRHRTVVIASLVVVMVGMVFFGIGMGGRMGSPYDTILKVNGKAVTGAQFERFYRNLSRQQPAETPEARQALTEQALRELIRHEVMHQEAKRFGIHVPDQELFYYISSVPAFHREDQFDPMQYQYTVRTVFGMQVREFEEMRRKDIAGQKLNQIIASAVQIPDAVFDRALKTALETETDPEILAALKENPETLREELRRQEIDHVFGDWLNQINARLRVNIVSESFRNRLQGEG